MSADATPAARLKHPRAIRWLHWINFPLLLVMIWSGLRIYWAEAVYALGIGSWQWFAFFPDAVYEQLDLDRHLARGIAFHFAFGWLFVINGVIYAIYLAVSGEWRSIVPDRRTPKEARDVVLHDLHLREEAPPQGLYNAAQRMTYTIVLAMAAVIVVSGFAIYKPTQLHPLPLLFGGYQGARFIHFTLTIGLLLFFLLHLVQVLRAGWKNLRAMITGYEIIDTTETHPTTPTGIADPSDTTTQPSAATEPHPAKPTGADTTASSGAKSEVDATAQTGAPTGADTTASSAAKSEVDATAQTGAPTASDATAHSRATDLSASSTAPPQNSAEVTS